MLGLRFLMGLRVAAPYLLFVSEYVFIMYVG